MNRHFQHNFYSLPYVWGNGDFSLREKEELTFSPKTQLYKLLPPQIKGGVGKILLRWWRGGGSWSLWKFIGVKVKNKVQFDCLNVSWGLGLRGKRVFFFKNHQHIFIHKIFDAIMKPLSQNRQFQRFSEWIFQSIGLLTKYWKLEKITFQWKTRS